MYDIKILIYIVIIHTYVSIICFDVKMAFN